jgi:hypothetical protein
MLRERVVSRNSLDFIGDAPKPFHASKAESGMPITAPQCHAWGT